MEAFIFPLIAFSVFIFFTEILTVDLTYNDFLILDFNLNIFGIRLYPGKAIRKAKKKRKSNAKGKSKAKIRKKAARQALFYVLSKTEIEIKQLDLRFYNSTSASAFPLNELAGGFAELLLSIISLYSKKTTVENIFIISSDNNNTEAKLQIKLTVPLFQVIFGFAIYLKEKNLPRRKQKNV